MDAPLPTHDALIRPWRTATVVASLVAAVELILLLGAAFLLLAKPIARAVRSHAETAALGSTKTSVKPAVVHPHIARIGKPKLTRARTSVLVLNGNGQTGAASTEATRLSGLGYRISARGNAKRQDYASTVVMYRKGFQAEGMRLAHDLHVNVVGPLDGLAPSALHGGQLAVVLGAN